MHNSSGHLSLLTTWMLVEDVYVEQVLQSFDLEYNNEELKYKNGEWKSWLKTQHSQN